MIADHNRRIFQSRNIVHHYAKGAKLTPAEATILKAYRSSYDGKRVLDLGVGCGRTTHWLAPFSTSYVGIDFSAPMIAYCKTRFPQYCFEHGDARDLARFTSGAFDFVLFSYNGLDFVDHSDRQKILKEISRVLVPGGVYAFSSHSLAWAAVNSRRRSRLKPRIFVNPLRTAKQLANLSLRFANYARYQHFQMRGADYAVLLDPASDFMLPIYYVNPPGQLWQLRAAGFDPEVRLFPEYLGWDTPPSALPLACHDAANGTPFSFYYVTTKL